MRIIQIQIRLGEVVALLVEAERVAFSCFGGVGDRVHGLDARGSHVVAAALEVGRKGFGCSRYNRGRVNGDRVGLGVSELRGPFDIRALLDDGGQLHAWSDVVDVRLQVFGDVISTWSISFINRDAFIKRIILVTSDPHTVAARMLVLIKLGQQQSLGFMGVCVKRQPAFVVGMDHARAMDSSRRQPLPYGVDGLGGWGERVVHLVCRPVLAVRGRTGVGTILSVDFGIQMRSLTPPSENHSLFRGYSASDQCAWVEWHWNRPEHPGPSPQTGHVAFHGQHV